jgi:uncharacterized repeat protein (TIGR02543 family)
VPEAVAVADGETIGKMPETAPEKEGFSFGGWYLNVAGDQFDPRTPVSGDITLIAKWDAPPAPGYVRVTFNGAGGNPGITNVDVLEGGTVNPLPTVERTGWTFGGWYPAESETEFTTYTAVNGAITVFAKWTVVTYSVSYNANGGTGSMASSTHTYGESKRLSAISTGTISNGSHTFAGWARSADNPLWDYADNEEVSDLAATQGAVVPLYAVWTIRQDTTTYTSFIYNDGNGDTTVSLGDDTAWAGNTANDRLAQLSGETGGLTFNGVTYQKESILSISWEEDVGSATAVGDNFLRGCSGLAVIDLSPLPALTGVGNGFLNGCSGLTTVNFGAVTAIPANTFYGGFNQLASVDAGSVVTIGTNAFKDCDALVTVNAPIAQTIGEDAFYDCDGLVTVDFPEAQTIGDYAFRHCNALETVNLLIAKTIGDYAFFYCVRLETVDFPEAETIGDFAFKFCGALETVDFPKALTIGVRAFYYCPALETVNLPKAQTIGQGAFGFYNPYLYLALASVTLPAGVDIMDYAFPGADDGNNLRSQYASGGAGTYTRTVPDGMEWTKQ